MNNEITSTSEMAETEWDGHSESSDVETDMVATKDAEGKGIEFHVSMRDYTMRDMEALIVEAAALAIVGKRGDNELSKLIEERCIAMTTTRVDRHLVDVTAAIVDRPLIPKYPFMEPDDKPVTMREFIGLTGEAYLTARVDSSGNPTTDIHYSKMRIQHLVEASMATAFKREIEASTNAAVAEVKNAIIAQHKALLDAEKARFLSALAKVTS